MPSTHLILCNPLLLLLSIFPSTRVFSNELVLHIRWAKYWSFSISPSNEYSGLISFRIDWFGLLVSKGLSRVFSSITIWENKFFGDQPFLWPNSHFHTWLLRKPYFWLYGPWSAKWCLCFLIYILSRLVIAFHPRSKWLLISWMQSQSAGILEPKKKKSAAASTSSPSVCHEVMGLH